MSCERIKIHNTIRIQNSQEEISNCILIKRVYFQTCVLDKNVTPCFPFLIQMSDVMSEEVMDSRNQESSKNKSVRKVARHQA